MEDLISVIIPAYNVAPWLPRCLDSVLAQTYKSLQIIVIDDGSIDETPQIVDQYAKKDARIMAIHQENTGLIEVRNRGIELAQGKYVTFVDGDDAVIPEMYERLWKNAVKYEADISHCGMLFCLENEKEEHYGTGKVLIQNNEEGLKQLLLGEQIEPSLCNKLYVREILKDSCGSLHILENEDLLRNFFLFQRAKRSVYEDFCGYLYMQRQGSMSRDSGREAIMAKQGMEARKIIVDHCEEEIMPYAVRSWLSAAVNAVNQLTFFKDNTDAVDLCKKCRSLLKREYKNIKFLIRRQRAAAILILLSPTLHRFVYGIYQRKYRRK